MLETVVCTRAMEFIPEPAEAAPRLHLLVVDSDAAMRSACAEIAATLGYAAEDTRNLEQARSLLRGQAVDILLVNLPWETARVWTWYPRSSCSTRRFRSLP